MKKMLIFFTILLISCNPAPEKIDFGNDNCAYCMMSISDAKFSSQMVMNTTKVYKFDAIECLSAYYKKKLNDKSKMHSMWVTHYIGNNDWIDVKQAYFVQNPKIKSPMGLHLAAFKTEAECEQFAYTKELTGMTWSEVLKLEMH